MATKGLLLGVSLLAIGGLAGCGRVFDTAASAGTQPPPPPAAVTAAVTEGVDASGDVAVGRPFTGSDGRPTAELTVVNTTPEKHDYTVAIVFSYGTSTDLLDVTTVSVLGVDPGTKGRATVESNKAFSGSTSASVTSALRSCVPR